MTAENPGMMNFAYGSNTTRYRSMTSCSGEKGRNFGVSHRAISRFTSRMTKNSTPKISPSRIFVQKTVQNTPEKWTSRNHWRST